MISVLIPRFQDIVEIEGRLLRPGAPRCDTGTVNEAAKTHDTRSWQPHCQQLDRSKTVIVTQMSWCWPQGHTTSSTGSAGNAMMLSAPNHAASRAIAFSLSTCVNKRARRTLGREHAT